MGYTFIGAIPDHWCKIDQLAVLALAEAGWTPEQIKNISIPKHATREGNYDQCLYYDLDYARISKSNYENALASVNFTTAETKSCSDWVYDTSIYKSTMVTEVSSLGIHSSY